MLSVYIDDIHQPLAPTELALSVKATCLPGAYCFVYHPADQPATRRNRSCPTDPPPAPPVETLYPADTPAADAAAPDTDEGSLISL